MEHLQLLYKSLELISFKDLSEIPLEYQPDIANQIEGLQDCIKLVMDQAMRIQAKNEK